MGRHWREDGRPMVGGFHQPSASVGRYAPPASILIPEPTTGDPVWRSLKDAFVLVFGLLFLAMAAACLPLAVFVLIFVSH